MSDKDVVNEVATPGEYPLLCPCGYPVEVGNVSGVTFYIHQGDRQPCEVANSYSVTPAQVMALLADNNPKYETAAFEASMGVRKLYYQHLAGCEDKDRRRELHYQLLGLITRCKRNESTILGELEYVFGDTIIENFKLLGDSRVVWGKTLTEGYRKKLPKYDIPSIKDETITDAFFDLDTEVATKRKTRRKY